MTSPDAFTEADSPVAANLDATDFTPPEPPSPVQVVGSVKDIPVETNSPEFYPNRPTHRGPSFVIEGVPVWEPED